jgi:hypothetical protein
LDEADAVVHYNGRKFDIPRINGEFVLAGMTPPSPFRQIDLLVTIKHKFDFEANSLDYICQRFGIGQKEHHDSAMWMKAILEDDAESWELMKVYNIGDVTITEALYFRILPWIDKHPNWSTYTGEICCPACGGDDFNQEGFAYTQQGRFQRYSCRGCGKWFRDPRRDQGAKVAEAV